MRFSPLRTGPARRRLLLAFLLPALLVALAGCACAPKTRPMASYDFSIHHPRGVEVYKPVAGVPPPNDFIYLYFRIENTSAKGTPLSFGSYDAKANAWKSIFNRLKPEVTVTSIDAPIVGAPVVLLGGLSGRNLCPGTFFPPNVPEDGDFPLNEANYRRDFAIRIKPDRSRVGQRGVLRVRFSLAYTKEATSNAPFVDFAIPVTISDKFRPESVTAQPSVHQ